MPKTLTQYRVFIGSPSGLDTERKLFRDTLQKYTGRDAEPRGVTFHPVGWEDTIGGVGRPQELINEDLKQCDYAVFVLHDHWGSPTGGGYSSGTEEEWELAEQLYKERRIRNIALFFKDVEQARLDDPGAQLAKVIEFKRQIESGKKYLFKSFAETDGFGEALEWYLARWLRDHEGTANAAESDRISAITSPIVAASVTPVVSTQSGPDFDYWIAEVSRLTNAETSNYPGALFCAEKAEATAGSDIQWARAKHFLGAVRFHLNNLIESIAAFTEITERFDSASDTHRQLWHAAALFGKGVALGQLGRSDEEIATYDEVVGRFGSASELPLRAQVAKALFNKGYALSQLGRSEEGIAAFDEVVDRFGSASELPLREPAVKALFNKGVALGQLGRSDEEIAAYDEVVGRLGSASELPLREAVAKALFNKGLAFGQFERSDEEIAVYDEIVGRFGSASELPLREQVARALVNKGVALGQLGRSDEEIAVYDEVVGRFGSASELPLREPVAKALLNKGITLRQLGRSEEAISAYDEVVGRFGSASELSLREMVARALAAKEGQEALLKKKRKK